MAGFMFTVNVTTGAAQLQGVGYNGAQCLDDPRMQALKQLLEQKGLVYNEELHPNALAELNNNTVQVDEAQYNQLER